MMAWPVWSCLQPNPAASGCCYLSALRLLWHGRVAPARSTFFGGNPCEVNDQRSKLDSSNSSGSIAMLVFTRDLYSLSWDDAQ